MRNRKINKLKSIFIFIVLIFFLRTNAFANDVEITADNIIIGTKNTVNITITIKNPYFSYINDKVIFDYFKLESEKTYAINKDTKFFEVKYTLRPFNAGSYIIDGVSVVFDDGSTQTADPIVITVVNDFLFLPNDTYKYNIPEEKKTFIQIETDKNTYYKGETIILNICLYSIYPIKRDYDYDNKIPSFQDMFWEPAYNDFTYLNRKTTNKTIDNIEYEMKIVDRRILYAKREGKYTFGPFKFRAKFGTSAIDDSSYIIVSDKKTITIKPLPDKDIPEGFVNSVGEFYISASVSGTTTQNNNIIPTFTGDTFLKFSLIISGISNPDVVNEPDVSMLNDYFQIISKDIIPKKEFTENGYSFIKTYEYILQPKTFGIIEIPSIKYPFFCIKEEKYKVNQTRQIKIEILKKAVNITSQIEKDSSLEIVVENLDNIKYPKTITNQNPYIITSSYRLIILIYFIIVIMLIPLSFIIHRYKLSLITNIEKQRYSNAYKKALTSINIIKANINNNELKEIYKKFHNIILSYISDTFLLSIGNTTLNNLVKTLHNFNLGEDIIHQIKEFIGRLDFLIYAGASDFSKDDIIKDLDNAISLILSIEEQKFNTDFDTIKNLTN